MLVGTSLDDALATTAQRLAAAIGASSASIELGWSAATSAASAFALRAEGEVIGTLVLPAAFASGDRDRIIERIVPAVQSVLAAALQRAALQAEVVETAALRRNDEMKTALLRSVSHDLRTPLTAIMTAAAALDGRRPEGAQVEEVRAIVLEAATRLAALVEKLLDLSRLQSGAGEQHVGAYSLDEVLGEAREHVDGDSDLVRLSLDDDLPLLEGDAGQLERPSPICSKTPCATPTGSRYSVRARVVGDRVRVRIVDQGPGIRRGELERIFMPFYRSPDQRSPTRDRVWASAIAKGFVEVNGGRISVESLPGQGSSFIVESR